MRSEVEQEMRERERAVVGRVRGRRAMGGEGTGGSEKSRAGLHPPQREGGSDALVVQRGSPTPVEQGGSPTPWSRGGNTCASGEE